MSDQRLHGIIPPVVTPMKPDGGLDGASLERHVSHLLDAGVHGFWVNGSTGEFHALDPDQRTAAVRTTAKAAGASVPVVAHVGDTATARVIAHARAAVDAGANHLSVIPPYYGVFTQAELRDHYRRIADAVGFPVLVYHLPRMTRSSLSVDSILELAREGAVIGVKDSANDMTWYRQLLRAAANTDVPLRCFTGGGSVTDLGLFLGGVGAMPGLANLTPRHLVAMYNAALSGDWVRLRTMQEELEDLIEALNLPHRVMGWADTISVYKFVLTATANLDGPDAAPPSAPLDESEKDFLMSKAVPLVLHLERPVS
ncbi:dihydrodipicolinate synthase family protein [Actinopolymorpha alba]|uniref:dihydrodipicolinate synthase family protein n=1 Tax=Actinopolymorpha alba TaxID=533267 RepID=UPI0003A31981|nr:dihydrodipicolinate synthase family protein [Actinopolymorpha alba]